MKPQYVATDVEDDRLEEYWREDDTAFVFEKKFDSIDGLADFLRKYFGERT